MTHLWQETILLTTCLFLCAIDGVCIAEDDPPPSVQANTPAYKVPQEAVRTAPESAPMFVGGSDMPNQVSDENPFVEVHYVVERPVTKQISQGGKVVKVTRYVREVRSKRVAVDANLEELDLPPDGKRAAVLAVTAARHEGLLKKLKEAESDEEKKEAADALKTNYTEHYAIETWWREQKLAELEERLTELREQVQQREESQEKYVDAAMTIAELWAEGIAIAPPKPNSAPEYGNTATPNIPVLPPPGPGNGYWSPATSPTQPPPTLYQPPATFSDGKRTSR